MKEDLFVEVAANIRKGEKPNPFVNAKEIVEEVIADKANPIDFLKDMARESLFSDQQIIANQILFIPFTGAFLERQSGGDYIFEGAPEKLVEYLEPRIYEFRAFLAPFFSDQSKTVVERHAEGKTLVTKLMPLQDYLQLMKDVWTITSQEEEADRTNVDFDFPYDADIPTLECFFPDIISYHVTGDFVGFLKKLNTNLEGLDEQIIRDYVNMSGYNLFIVLFNCALSWYYKYQESKDQGDRDIYYEIRKVLHNIGK